MLNFSIFRHLYWSRLRMLTTSSHPIGDCMSGRTLKLLWRSGLYPFTLCRPYGGEWDSLMRWWLCFRQNTSVHCSSLSLPPPFGSISMSVFLLKWMEQENMLSFGAAQLSQPFPTCKMSQAQESFSISLTVFWFSWSYSSLRNQAGFWSICFQSFLKDNNLTVFLLRHSSWISFISLLCLLHVPLSQLSVTFRQTSNTGGLPFHPAGKPY